jgi:hypothetical protein
MRQKMTTTKKDWTRNIIEEFKFLSNPEDLKKSWVTGEGKFSAGYYEEICVIYDDLLFESHFLNESQKFNFSNELLDLLIATNECLNGFDGSALDPGELLIDPRWIRCMELMRKTAEKLEMEIHKVPNIPINDPV